MSYLNIPTDTLHKFQAIGGSLLVIAPLIFLFYDRVERDKVLVEIHSESKGAQRQIERVESQLDKASEKDWDVFELFEAMETAAKGMKCPSPRCDEHKQVTEEIKRRQKELEVIQTNLNEELRQLQVKAAAATARIEAFQFRIKASFRYLIIALLPMGLGLYFAIFGFRQWAKSESEKPPRARRK